MRSSIKVKALVLILVLVLAFLQLGCSGNEAIPSPTPVKPTPSPPPTKPIPVEPKVNIVIYTDYQCPGCAELHKEVEPELVRRYVNTDKAQLEVRLLTTLGPESVRAAEATLCAADQEKFWEYRAAILTAWSGAGKGAYSEEELKKAASEVGLDIATFSTCLDSGAKRAQLEKYIKQAIADKVTETPMLYINDIVVIGPQALDVYVNIIEAQLSKNM